MNMANVQKFNAASTAKVIGHNYRNFEYSVEYMSNPKHSIIDYNLTAQNYSVTNYNAKKRLEELKKKNHVRNKTTVNMFDWVVQIPDNCQIEETEFFATLVESLKDRYGEENFLGDIVHRDEPNSRTHIHCMIAPIKDKKFNAKAILTKQELSEFHDYLNSYFHALGYEINFHADDYEKRKSRNEEVKALRKEAIKKYKTVTELRTETAEKVNTEIKQIEADSENKVNEYIDITNKKIVKACESIDKQAENIVQKHIDKTNNDLDSRIKEITLKSKEKLKNLGLEGYDIIGTDFNR